MVGMEPIPGGPVNAGQNAFTILNPLIGQGGANIAAQLLGPYMSEYLGNPMGNIGMTSGMGHYYGNMPYEAADRIGQAGQRAQQQGYENLVRNVTGMLGPQYRGAENSIAGGMAFMQGMGIPMPNVQGGNPQDLANSVQRAFPGLTATDPKLIGGERSTWEWLTDAPKRPKMYDHTPTAEDGEIYFNSVYRNMVDDKGAVNQEYARGFDMGEVGTMMEEMARQRAYDPLRGGANPEENIAKQTGEMIELMETMKEAFGSPDSSVFELIDTMNDVFGDNSLVRQGAEKMTRVVQELDATRVQMGMTKRELQVYLQQGNQIAAGYGHRQNVGVAGTQYALEQTEIRRRLRQDAIRNGSVDPYRDFKSDEEFMAEQQHSYNQSYDSDVARNAGTAQNMVDQMRHELSGTWRWWDSKERRQQREFVEDWDKALESGDTSAVIKKYGLTSEEEVRKKFKEMGRSEGQIQEAVNNWKRGRDKINAENPDFIAGIKSAGRSEVGEAIMEDVLSNKTSAIYRDGGGQSFKGLDTKTTEDILLSKGRDMFTGTEEARDVAAAQAALEAAKQSGEFDKMSWTQQNALRRAANDTSWYEVFDNVTGIVGGYLYGDDIKQRKKDWRSLSADYQAGLDSQGIDIEDRLLDSGNADKRLNLRNTSTGNDIQELLAIRNGINEGSGAAMRSAYSRGAYNGPGNLDEVTAKLTGAATLLATVGRATATGEEVNWDRVMSGAVRQSKEDFIKDYDSNKSIQSAAESIGMKDAESTYKTMQSANTLEANKVALAQIQGKGLSGALGLGDTWWGRWWRSEEDNKNEEAIKKKNEELELEHMKGGGVGTLEEAKLALNNAGAATATGTFTSQDHEKARKEGDKMQVNLNKLEEVEARKLAADEASKKGTDRVGYIMAAKQGVFGEDDRILTEAEQGAKAMQTSKDIQADFFTDEDRRKVDQQISDEEYNKHRKDPTYKSMTIAEKEAEKIRRLHQKLKDTDPAKAKEFEQHLAAKTKEAVEGLDEEQAAIEQDMMVGDAVSGEAAYADMFSDAGNYKMGQRIGGDVARTQNVFAQNQPSSKAKVEEEPLVTQEAIIPESEPAINPVEEAEVSPTEEKAAAESNIADQTAAVTAPPPDVKVEETGAGTADGGGGPVVCTGPAEFLNDIRRGNERYDVELTFRKKGAG